MAAGTRWKCTHCGYKVTTSGLHEFYRDSEGTRKPYGHPLPNSVEAAECGIRGFSKRAYCPACDAIRDVVVMEFDDSTGPGGAWKRALEVAKAYSDIGGLFECICPECKTKLLEELADVECPRCKQGVFKYEINWVS